MTRRFVTLAALAARITLLHGWRRAGVAALAGAVSALAMPPFSVWPILFLTLPVAVWLIDGAAAETRTRGALVAAGVGFCFGFGYFLAGLWWIGSAFLVDADVFGWLLPFAVAGLPALLSTTTAAGFAAARLMWSPGPGRVLVFAAMAGIGEILRGHLFTGFPWNSFGYALADQAWLGQFASVVGVEGLTFVAFAIFAAPATLADGRPSRALLAAATVSLAGLAVFGAVRLAMNPTGFDSRVTVRAIQPEIPQDMKSQESERDTVMDAYLSLSDEARGPDRGGFADADLVVWPESAFPFLLSRTPEALARIGRAMKPGATVVTGAIRGERKADGSGAEFWNALHMIGDDGSILATYDKIHLVPFGEYLPFQTALESIGLEAVTRQRGGFAVGDRRTAIALPQGPKFRPLICYEAIFPEEVTDPDGERPDFLLNVTNDAWFGRTPGPYQHAAQARVRTIEQGLPMVRSANGGVASIVDAYGRTIASAPLGARDVVDSKLPLPIETTLFITTSGRLFGLFPLLFLSFGYAMRSRV